MGHWKDKNTVQRPPSLVSLGAFFLTKSSSPGVGGGPVPILTKLPHVETGVHRSTGVKCRLSGRSKGCQNFWLGGGIRLKQVMIFTDGACSGNPGAGGWGAVLRFGPHEKELSGGEAQTTNNRMELTGVIMALSALKEPCKVELTTDSRYVVDSVTKGWVYGWKKKGWMRTPKEPAKNADLWKQLLGLLEQHEVTFHWVKGHAGHPENERCDTLAVEAIAKIRANL